MNWKRIASVGLFCLMAACTKKEADKSPETFTLAGTVSAHAGPVLSGVKVNVIASDYTPVSGTNNRYTVGETTTDYKGHFEVVPQKYNNIAFYELHLTKEGYYEKIVTIQAEAAKKAPQSVYSLDIDMSPL